MKFTLKQEKLQEMLEKLMLKNVFPSCVLTTRPYGLLSIQKDPHARALRLLKCQKGYFETFEGEEEETIEIADMEQLLGLVKRYTPGQTIKCYTEGNMMHLEMKKEDGRKRKSKVPLQEPEEVIKEVPFNKNEDGDPQIGKEEEAMVVLDKKIDINLQDFRDIIDFTNPLKTEFYKFITEDGKMNIRVGDLTENSADTVEEMNCKMLKGDFLEVIFAFGITQIAESFTQENFRVRTNTHSPGWFFEGDKTYTLGVLLPPFTSEE